MADLDFSIKALFLEAAGNPFLKETSDRLCALTFRMWYFNLLNMNAEDWNIEVAAVRKEFAETSVLLSKSTPREMGLARKQYLWDHLERIRSKFLGLSVRSFS